MCAMFFRSKMQSKSLVSFLQNAPFAFSRRNRCLTPQRNTVDNSDSLRNIAIELNNVGVELYKLNDRLFALKLYTYAVKAIMAMVRQGRHGQVAIDEVRTDFVEQLVRGKQRLHNLACFNQKQSKDGLESYQWSASDYNLNPLCICEAIKIEAVYDYESTETDLLSASTIMYNLGLIHMKDKEFTIAGKIFELAMGLRKEIKSTDRQLCESVVFASLVNNIGCMQYEYDFSSEAKVSFFEALQIGESAMSVTDETCLSRTERFVGTIFYNIGVMEARMGSQDKIVSAFNSSLMMQKRAIGENDLDISIVQQKIGMIYFETGKMDHAMNAFLESLRVIRFSNGNTHPDTAKVLRHLGQIHKKNDEYEEALHVYQETLSVERASLGINHPDTVMTLCEIGQIHHMRGNLDKALNLYNDALTATKDSLNSSGKTPIIFILCQLIRVHIESGNVSKATRIHTEMKEELLITSTEETAEETYEVAQISYLLAYPPAAAAA